VQAAQAEQRALIASAGNMTELNGQTKHFHSLTSRRRDWIKIIFV